MRQQGENGAVRAQGPMSQDGQGASGEISQRLGEASSYQATTAAAAPYYRTLACMKLRAALHA